MQEDCCEFQASLATRETLTEKRKPQKSVHRKHRDIGTRSGWGYIPMTAVNCKRNLEAQSTGPEAVVQGSSLPLRGKSLKHKDEKKNL